MKKKSDVILVAVTVILVIVLIGGFIYDRNDALLERTNFFPIASDKNLKVVKMEKVGFLYMRAYYEAKVQILDNNPDKYIINIASTYQANGQMFDYTQYKEYESKVLDKVTLKPDPRQDSFIWVLAVPLDPNSSKNIVYIISVEGEGEAYIYMYYSRK